MLFTQSWNKAQIEMLWKMARKIFDIGKAWIRIPLDRVFWRKFLCFENCWREIHFCQCEINFATFTLAKKCRREKFWVRKAESKILLNILFSFYCCCKLCQKSSRVNKNWVFLISAINNSCQGCQWNKQVFLLNFYLSEFWIIKTLLNLSTNSFT